jgi:hypothetical protein
MIVNNVISRNSAFSYARTTGGGIVLAYSEVTIANSTITCNTAASSCGITYFGGIYSYEGTLTINNSIVWGNEATYSPQLSSSAVTVAYSDIQDGSGESWFGPGCIDEYPQFASVSDYHLTATSPCIDKGNSNALPLDELDLDGDGDTTEPVPFDFDGNDRISNGTVDMGAYEYAGAVIEEAWSCKTYGEGGGFRLPLNDNKIEPRKPGVSRLEFVLNKPAGSVSAGVSCSESPGYQPQITVSGEGTDLIAVEFDPPLPDQDCCTITLTGGVEGGFQVRTLAGDINRDGKVTTGDMSIIKPHFREYTDEDNVLYDFNCDGVITTSDFSQIKPLLQHTAPACGEKVRESIKKQACKR